MLKTKIAILATGGTIAGFIDDAIATTRYSAGVIDVDFLIQRVPQIQDLAHISTENIANIDSCNMRDEIWLKLLRRINKLFADGVDGIVITHGTDTIEESAYFLHLSIKSHKVVVLVGAMRPLSAMSTDGYKNLYNAVVLATNKEARAKGVMIVMNDRIFSARAVVKTHSLNVDALSSPNFGDLGYIVDTRVFFQSHILKMHTKNTPFNVNELENLPRVDILYTYSNDGNAITAKVLFENGTRGIVVAGSGLGNIHEDQKNVLKELIKRGLYVVVSSRVMEGRVVLSDTDKKLGFISAEDLNPQKARVLLMLALSKTSDRKKIQEYFLSY